MTAPLLAVSNLTMRFGGLVAIDNISLTVEPGRIHAIIGPNGAGKSTLFNCISGFYKPSGGSIVFDGKDLHSYRKHDMARLGIARSFQNLELFGSLSVRENIRLGMFSRGGTAKGLGFSRGDEASEQAEADAIMEQLGLTRFADMAAKLLDFGAQKLVELARALAMKPKLLLLDEPAAGLRNQAIKALDETLARLSRDQGLTIILVEHVMALVMSISQRITVLNFGKVIAEGEPNDIRTNPDVVKAYLGRRSVDA